VTLAVRDWLPRQAFSDEAVRSVLAKTVAEWSARWFVGKEAFVERVQSRDVRGEPAEGLLAQGAAAEAELPPRGKRHLLEAALDAQLVDQALGESDHRLLDAFAGQIVENLVTELDRLFDNSEDAQKQGHWLAVGIGFSDHSVMTLHFPAHVLIARLKMGWGGSKHRGPQPVKLRQALGASPVTAQAILGNVELTLNELRGLAVGDVVLLDTPLRQPVELRLAQTSGQIGRGKLCQSNGKISLQF
jgi:flagellar motor switch/type III secretory pathway protein FliN